MRRTLSFAGKMRLGFNLGEKDENTAETCFVLFFKFLFTAESSLNSLTNYHLSVYC